MGYRAIKVKAIGLEMSEEEGGALDAMDDEAVQYFLLKGRKYPAFCWTEKYDKYRDSDPELSETFTNSLIQILKILTNK
ncbi:MAG: hypothetical protein ACRYGR_02795 [Janthinobacterium lividum]